MTRPSSFVSVSSVRKALLAVAWSIAAAMLAVAAAFWFLRRTTRFADLSVVVEGLGGGDGIARAAPLALGKVALPVAALFAALTALAALELRFSAAPEGGTDETALVAAAAAAAAGAEAEQEPCALAGRSSAAEASRPSLGLEARGPPVVDRCAMNEPGLAAPQTLAAPAVPDSRPMPSADEPGGVSPDSRQATTMEHDSAYQGNESAAVSNAIATLDEWEPMPLLPFWIGNVPPESPAAEKIEAMPVVSPPEPVGTLMSPASRQYCWWFDPIPDWTRNAAAVDLSLESAVTANLDPPQDASPPLAPSPKRGPDDDPLEASQAAAAAAADPTAPPAAKRARYRESPPHGDVEEDEPAAETPVATPGAAPTNGADVDGAAASRDAGEEEGLLKGADPLVQASDRPIPSAGPGRFSIVLGLTPQAEWLVARNDPDAWMRCFLSDVAPVEHASAPEIRDLFLSHYNALRNGVVGVRLVEGKHTVDRSPPPYLRGGCLRAAWKLRSMVEKALDELLVCLEYIENRSQNNAGMVWSASVPRFPLDNVRQRSWNVMEVRVAMQRRRAARARPPGGTPPPSRSRNPYVACGRVEWPPTHARLRSLALDYPGGSTSADMALYRYERGLI